LITSIEQRKERGKRERERIEGVKSTERGQCIIRMRLVGEIAMLKVGGECCKDCKRIPETVGK
jgi:hypothetical protein